LAPAIDGPSLIRQRELADFASRQALAQAAAAALAPEQLPDVTRLLAHPHEKVRLGAIEVLCRTGRDSVAALLHHAQQRTGDDRVFAIRALVHLARPGDEALHASARAWLAHDDHFVQAQARLLARALALPGEAVPVPARGSAPPAARPAGGRAGATGLRAAGRPRAAAGAVVCPGPAAGRRRATPAGGRAGGAAGPVRRGPG